MAASTSTAVQFEQEEDGVLLRAVLIQATQEFKDYKTKHEDQSTLNMVITAPENKSVLDILAMRECRLDAALVRESHAISTLANFCVAEKGALQAHSAATAAALSPLIGAGATTTSIAPATSLGTSGKKIMKRKLPELNDGWEDHSRKTHRVHHETMQYQ